MVDIVTYIPDLSLFREEVETKARNGEHGFIFDLDGDLHYNIAKIPVHYNKDGIRSLCVIRLSSQQDIDTFNSISSCEKIGEYKQGAYLFDTGGDEIYNSVYERSTITTAEGDYTAPEMIGVIS